VTTSNGGARGASNTPATEPTVDADRGERIASNRASRRHQSERDMDRYIADTYGSEWVSRSKR